MIRILPHHLLDIVRNYGNDVKMENEHPWGALLLGVTSELLADFDQTIELVMGADSICKPCSKLQSGVCEAQLGDDTMMREYNNPLDRALFDALGCRPGDRMTVREFLERVGENMGILNLFTRGKSDVRAKGTQAALVKLGLAERT